MQRVCGLGLGHAFTVSGRAVRRQPEPRRLGRAFDDRKWRVARKFRNTDDVLQPVAGGAPSQTDASDVTTTTAPVTGTSQATTPWTAFLYSYTVPLSTMAAIHVLSTAPAALASSATGFVVGAVASIIVFGVTPILDLVLGSDGANPSKADLPELAASAPHKQLLRGYALLQLATLVVACRYVATCPTPVAWPAALGLTLGLGTIGAVGFTVAHDLIHSADPLDQRLALLQLSSMGYPHWSLSHLSHHVKVATPEDPASAHLNESLWAFIPRSVWGNLMDGLRMERQRLRDTGASLWSLKNRMWVWLATPLALAAGLWVLWGGAAVALMAGQAAGAVALLEAVNYVEHYGLSRKKLPSGRYEKTGARHSWNGDFKATNCVAFKIQRHADHHVNAALPYQALSSITEEAPQLPGSYPLMVMLAVLPPLWFTVMNPILEAEQFRLDELERRATPEHLPAAAA